jgi:hypothetical protein
MSSGAVAARSALLPPELCPHQRLVFDAVRLVGVGAEAASAVGLVIGVFAFEPLDLAVALEGENVRRDAIEKPVTGEPVIECIVAAFPISTIKQEEAGGAEFRPVASRCALSA